MNNRKTPEEIANSYPVARTGAAFINYDNTLDAMQQYADQEMAAFAEWMGNKWTFKRNSKKWVDARIINSDPKNYTTAELITKFKEETKQ